MVTFMLCVFHLNFLKMKDRERNAEEVGSHAEVQVEGAHWVEGHICAADWTDT